MCAFQRVADTGNLQVQFGYICDMNRNAHPVNTHIRAHRDAHYTPAALGLIIELMKSSKVKYECEVGYLYKTKNNGREVLQATLGYL